VTGFGKSMGTPSDVVEQFDESNDVQVPSGCHHCKKGSPTHIQIHEFERPLRNLPT